MRIESFDCPKVSVILTIYNVEPFLRQCLDSIVNQTLNDIEIICVDDGSTDSSLKILKEYQLKDNRIIIIEQENRGAGAARNAGLDIAKGEYLSILDSDDFFELDMLEKAYKASLENNADITVFRANFYDHRESRFEPCDYSIKPDMMPENNPFSAEEISDRIFNIGCGWAWDKLFKRSFVETSKIRFQEIRTTNDMLFVFYLYSKAERIFFFDGLLAHHRINAYETLSVTRERSWNNFYLALSELKDRLIKDGTYELYKHSFANWALNFSLWHIDTLDSIVSRHLIIKCRQEYFEKLDILKKDESYFINRQEYERLMDLMNTGDIKVSVIVPVYNGERYLRTCLDSILGQSLKEIQIICVDDGSTDSTPEILKEYEGRNERLVVITKEHTNAGDSRNAGLELAEGEYLSFLDADDFFESYMLNDAYDAAKNDKAEICAFRCNQYDEASGEFRECPWTLKLDEMPQNHPFSNYDCADRIFTMASCTAWDKLFKRDFINENNIRFQNVESCNDMLFTFSAFSVANRITTLDKLLVHQRVNHIKTLANEIDYLWHNFYDALKNLKSFLEEREMYLNFKKSFVNWAADFCLWNLHNYKDYYRHKIRLHCRKHYFADLDLVDCPKEFYNNPVLFDEVHTILYENEVINNENAPVVSVIIPVFNADKFLRECLNSILSQTLSSIEIICVDDGSTDDSYLILEEYAAKDKRVKVFRQNNAGAGVARNLALSHANGNFLFFSDADDFFEQDMLEICTETAIQEQSDIVVFSANKFDHANERFLPGKLVNIAKYSPDHTPFSPQEMREGIFLAFQNWPWNKFFRHSFIQEYGIKFQDVARSNDVAFVITALCAANRISVIDHVFAHYRVNTGSSLQQTKSATPLAFVDAYREAKNRMMKLGVYKEFERSFLNKLLSTICHNIKTIDSIAALHEIISYFKYIGDHEFKISLQNKEIYFDQNDVKLYLSYLGDSITFSPIKLSVVIPVYNAEKYIRQTLNSILTQSLKRIEVICVDDGSTDSSREIIEEYMEKDSRVQLLCQENQFAGAARNRGLTIASGEYIHFLDADDFVVDYAYEAIYQKAKKYDLDCLKFCSIAFDEKNQITIDNPLYSMNDFHRNDFLTYLDINNPVIYSICRTPWSGIYKRTFLIENEITFNNLYCVNDRSFYAHVITKAKKMMISRDRLVVHRVNMAESLVGKRMQHFDCHMSSIRIIEKQLQTDNIDYTIQNTIMKKELSDLLAWCKKYSTDQIYGEKILHDTISFVEQLNYDFVPVFLNRLNKLKGIVKTGDTSNTSITTTLTTAFNPINIFHKMSDYPLVSVFVVVPAEKVEIDEVLNTLSMQAFEAVVYHIIVDNKRDDVLLSIRAYNTLDKRINLFHSNTNNFEKNIEIARKRAKAPYLMFLKAEMSGKLDSLDNVFQYVSKNDLKYLNSDTFVIVKNDLPIATYKEKVLSFMNSD